MRFILLLLTVAIASHATGQLIYGTVRDENGNPLPFASIIVKGTSKGVVSNSAGFYQIQLSPGFYAIQCHYVGYTTTEKRIELGNADTTLDFVMRIQRLEMKEIVIAKGGEDPAYEIIRNAIRQRPYYEGQVSAFSADVYIKGMIRLLNLPQRVLGKKIPEEDRKDMALDSAGQGIVYLSESLTHVSVEKPDKIKMDVISSRVSGSDGFGFDFPVFIDFYKNNVDLSEKTVGQRGFVSPIADNALNFYRYKFLGSFFENGKEINTIRVTPKRDYEPLFSGIINISDGDWRIFNCKLFLTKKSQLQIVDTIRISQIYEPVWKDIWRIRNQTIYFHASQLGIEANGDFVNVYSNYDLDPRFPKDFFGKTIIRYDTAANKRDSLYWTKIRPVPLEPDESRDFQLKDSLKLIRDTANRILMNSKKITALDWIWNGVNKWYQHDKQIIRFRSEPVLKTIQYNTVEGIAVNPSVVLSKNLRTMKTNASMILDARYGFGNRHFNPWVGFVFNSDRNSNDSSFYNYHSFSIAGGKRVSQFYKESRINGLLNSISTLFYGGNDMKLYENYFAKASYDKKWDNGNEIILRGLYEDRIPIENSTMYIFNKKWKTRLTPNYPVEILDSQFARHQAAIVNLIFRFQPGQQYIQYPNYRMSLGSTFPKFEIQYQKGIQGILGSDVNFDKWQFNVTGDADLKLAGTLKYFFSTGGFLNSKEVFVQDYKHFNANTYHVVDEYLFDFQNAGVYQYSNKSPYYAEFHFEHHAKGMITNKIPLLRKLNWFLVEGANSLYVSPRTGHLELFAGLENILKIFRVDVMMTMQNGFKPAVTYRIGFGGLIGDALNAANSVLGNTKIIGKW